MIGGNWIIVGNQPMVATWWSVSLIFLIACYAMFKLVQILRDK